MTLNYQKYRSSYIVISGLLAGCVFSLNLSALLLPLILVPFLLSFVNHEKISFKQAIGENLAFFVPFLAVVWSWFLAADISSLAQVTPSTAFKASALSLIIFTLYNSLFMLPLGFLNFFLSKSKLRSKTLLIVLVIVPAAWVVCECLRSYGFSAVSYGQGATFGDYWNFGDLGLAMMFTPLSNLSSLIGMYGLSYVCVMLSGLLAILIRSPKKRQLWLATSAVFASCIILSVIGRISWSGQSQKLSGSVEQIEYLIPHDDTTSEIKSYDPAKKDLIVLPEYSTVFDKIALPMSFADKYVNSRLKTTGSTIDVGAGDQNNKHAAINLRNSSGQIVQSTTKEFLIPTGEYMPYSVASFYKLIGNTSVIKDFNQNRRIKKGQPPKVLSASNFKIGPISCSGILGRNIYRQLTSDGANVLTNSASLVIFNQSRSYFRQSLMMAKFHANANKRTFIQASKRAPAFVIDQNGNYIVKPGDSKDKFVDFSFTLSSAKTLYTRVGEWVLYLSIIIVIVIIILMFT